MPARAIKTLRNLHVLLSPAGTGVETGGCKRAEWEFICINFSAKAFYPFSHVKNPN
jgi:hypothetical protein